MKRHCFWTLNGNHWFTECGNQIADDDTSYDWQHCPYCGAAIIKQWFDELVDPNVTVTPVRSVMLCLATGRVCGHCDSLGRCTLTNQCPYAQYITYTATDHTEEVPNE